VSRHGPVMRMGVGAMSEIIACGYVGVTAPDLQAWRTFATEGLGLQPGPGSGESALLLRMDERAWRVCVLPGPGGLAFSGWEVPDSRALSGLGERLERAGVEVKADDDLAAERGVEALLRCEDPAGNQVEFFYGARISAEAFISPTGASFVTGHSVRGDMGFGHIVVSYPDLGAARSFFFDVLGFRISDICLLGEPWFFAHVNPRHHSLALGPGPGPSALHHFMLEVTDLDVVGRALDYFSGSPYAPTTTLGKHTNDHMVSFYVRTPSGFEVEYGCNGRLIDDTCWTTATYESASVWGHKAERL
jgi:2,3-dihydroxybiphenyl 1,2-dioxygenase